MFRMSLLDQAKQLVGAQLLNKRETSVLGVDIGTSAIKVVQLRNEQGTALLETYGEIALGPFGESSVGQATNLEPAALAKALRELIEESGVTTTACGVSVPFAASLVKLIELPALDNKKLATAIPIEARKYIPVPISEVQLDWFIVPETEQRLFEGTTEGDATNLAALQKRLVLIVAMHNQTLQKYAEVMRLAGLNAAFYEIEVFSNIRSTISRSLAPVAILDVGAATSKLYIVELGIILSSHVVPVGSQDITRSLANATHVSTAKAEELKRQAGIMSDAQQGDVSSVSHAATLTMEQVLADARRVLLGFQRRYNKVITKVILTGGGATLRGLQDFAREQLELEVELANPFTHVQAPAFLDDVLKQAGPDFVVAVGLAMRKLQDAK